jgi:hypothetical protein
MGPCISCILCVDCIKTLIVSLLFATVPGDNNLLYYFDPKHKIIFKNQTEISPQEYVPD